ncbi:MAG: DJ-1/PfpI family protein [Chitinophagales bacterium]
MKPQNVAIFIFNDAEVLDFTGPFEVFNIANTVAEKQLFNVFLVAASEQMIYAKNNFKVLPDYNFTEMPEADILIIPGGSGSKVQMHLVPVLNWVKHEAGRASLVLSVCTGSFILGNAGLLNNLAATTHHGSYDEFEKEFSTTKLIRGVKYVENEKVITAGGISAGIDMSIMVVGKIHGNTLAQQVAERMEYTMAGHRAPM